MKKTKQITATNIRYLLAMKKLFEAKKEIHGSELASLLSLRKPTVHSMFESLIEMRWIQKDQAGVVFFTESGYQTACRYQQYFHLVLQALIKTFSSSPYLHSMTYAVLGELPESELCRHFNIQ